MSELDQYELPFDTTLKINGQEVRLPHFGDLAIDNVSDGMERIAAEIAYYGALWAEAQMHADDIDAKYRQWRAQFASDLLEENPKLSEHKIKAQLERTENFLKFKQAIAMTARNAQILRNFFEALRARASALQSRGAMMRAEMDSMGMSTPASPAKKKKMREATSRNSEAA